MSTEPHGKFLGQASSYPTHYSPQVLQPVPRSLGRQLYLADGVWPHHGIDVWTLYEVAFKEIDGRPHVGMAELHIPSTSPNIVESKSLKLYLFSLNDERFKHRQAYAERVCEDISQVVGAPAKWHWRKEQQLSCQSAEGACIDRAPYASLSLDDAAQALVAQGPTVSEVLHSELLRSLCPVTAQPDWATLVLRYKGPQIHQSALLNYIAAYYRHQGFHEQCVEQIFLDVLLRCACEELTVFARYTRRGGIDINPLRSTQSSWAPMARTFRQ